MKEATRLNKIVARSDYEARGRGGMYEERGLMKSSSFIWQLD